MRDFKEVKTDIAKLYGEIAGIGASIQKEDHRERFKTLKEEVRQHFPKAALFNKKIFLSSSFDYEYPKMQEELSEMLKL